MKKSPIRILSVFLVLVTICTMTIPAMATDNAEEVAPRASAYIAVVWASCSGGSGSVTVDFDITATGRMSSLGATLITIKDTSGTTVKSFSYSTTSGMMGYNQGYFSSSVTWNGASSGERYYAIVFYKAANSSGSDTTSYTTSFCTAK